MKKLAIAVVVLVVLGIGGVFGLEFYAQGQAERRVDTILAQLQPGATASRGAVRYDLWGNVVEVENIALALAYGDEAALTIDRLILVQPAEDQEGVITIESFEADGLALRLAGLTFDPPVANIAEVNEAQVLIGRYHGRGLRIQPGYLRAHQDFFALESVSFANPAFVDLLDPLTRGLDAEKLIADRSDGAMQLVMVLPRQERASVTSDFAMENYTLHDLENGRVESLTWDSLSIKSVIEGQAIMKTAMVTDSASMSGLDLATMVQAYRPADPSGPGPYMPVIEEIVMQGLAYQVSGDQLPEPVAIDVARMTLTDYAVRPGLAALLDADLENATPEELSALLETMLDLYRIGGVEIAGLTVSKAASDQGAAGEPLFTMGRMAIADYEGARLGRIAFEDIAAEVEGEGRFALAAFELGGLDYSGALAHWQKLAAGEPWPLGSMPRLDLLALAGLRVETGDAAVTLEEVRGESADYVQSVATRSTFLLKGLEVPLDLVPDPNLAAMAQLMGLDSVVISFAGGYRWDMAAREAHLEGFELSLLDLGVLSFEMAVSGLGEEFIPAVHGDMTALAPEALSQLLLSEARLTYQDQSLLPRLFKALAESSGQDEAQIKAAYGAQAEALAAVLQDPALIERVVAALRAFIADPGRLEIALNPEEPVALVLIPSLSEAAPGELAKALNLTVRATVQ